MATPQQAEHFGQVYTVLCDRCKTKKRNFECTIPFTNWICNSCLPAELKSRDVEQKKKSVRKSNLPGVPPDPLKLIREPGWEDVLPRKQSSSSRLQSPAK